MTSKLELLQRERDSFIAHERRIMRERDEVLVNIRNQISALDNEILRLGGDINKSEHAHVSSPLFGHVVPSTASFPSIKKPLGTASIGGENSRKKKRGRPRKSKIAEFENEITRSDTPKKRHEPPSKSHSIEIDRPNDAISPLTSIATSLVNLKTNNRFEDYVSNITSTKIAKWPDWQCECGELIAHRKSRCGKCRRWKGGKREKKWTLKGRKAKDHLKQAKVIYNTLSSTTLDATTNLNSEDCNAHGDRADEINIRTEVETIVRNMALAVSTANDKQTNEERKKTSDPKKKRKRRGTDQKAAEQEGINTVVKPHHIGIQPTEEEGEIREKAMHAPYAFESLCIVAKMHMNNEAPQDEIHHRLPKC